MRLILDKLKLIEREKKKIIYKPSTRKESRNFGKKVIFFSIEIMSLSFTLLMSPS